MDHAAPNATIELAAGTYRLAQPLTVSTAVTMVGAGLGKTEVISSGKGWVVRFQGAGPYAVQGISFTHTGLAKAETVVVKDGEVDFNECRFSGAVGTDTWYSSGLWLRGAASGTVRVCRMTNNDCGVELSGQSKVMVESNVIGSNKYGLVFDGSASGAARANTLSKNSFCGLFVSDEARPTLDSNTVKSNKEGIYFLGKATGSVENNRVFGNSDDGIWIDGKAHPAVRNNECHRNSANGISVTGSARPEVRGNTCTNNKGVGIGFWGTTAGRLSGNTCDHNGTKIEGGICIGGHARPVVSGNRCEHNVNYGILYRDHAGGTCSGNYCGENKYGILINMQAYPKLVNNDCEWNSENDTETYRG